MCENTLQKWVKLDELPKYKNRKHGVDWRNSIGMYFEFYYKGIQGRAKVLGYDVDRSMITITKDDGLTSYEISSSSLSNCSLGGFLGVFSKTHKYNVGDLVNGMIVVEQIQVKSKNLNIRGYLMKCLIDGFIKEYIESNLDKGHGCSVCCNRTCVNGINDIGTTHPYYIKYFSDINDAYTHTVSSNKKALIRCPDCGSERRMTINKLTGRPYMCTICGDGISYPEKFMISVLKQLNIDFIQQLSKSNFEWCGSYRYDFYIPSINMIVETHGNQHYEYTGFKNNLESVIKNDNDKLELAIRNNTKYCIINCRHSEKDYIKDSIFNTTLSDMFNLVDVDWDYCDRFATSNMVKTICDEWMSGNNNTMDISVKYRLNRSTVIDYLKRGSKINWCDYDADFEKSKNGVLCAAKNKKLFEKEVFMYNLNGEYLNSFESISNAGRFCGLKTYSNISSCCNGNRNKAGGYIWRYFKVDNVLEYEKQKRD